MQVTLKPQVSNARMLDKELVSAYVAVAMIDGKMVEPVTVRCWMGRSANSSTVYASVWVHHSGYYTSGRGKAGGYGYCKESAAAYEAFRSAGIDFDMCWSAAGESKIVEAIESVCRELGYATVHVVRV